MGMLKLFRQRCRSVNLQAFLVRHFCLWLELAQVEVGQHTRFQSISQHTESSGRHRPRTTRKEIVHHNQLWTQGNIHVRKMRYSWRRPTKFTLLCYHKLLCLSITYKLSRTLLNHRFHFLLLSIIWVDVSGNRSAYQWAQKVTSMGYEW